MDPLVEIPKEKWGLVRDLFRLNWPRGLAGHHLLDTQLTFGFKSIEFKVYSAFGDVNSGFVAVNKFGTSYEVAIEPLPDNLDKMTEALCSTKVIDWAHPSLLLCYLDDDVKEILPKVCKSQNVETIKECKAYKHVYNSDVGFNDLIIPPNTYMGKLKPEHLQMVDNSWPYHDFSSHLIFQDAINNGLTYALYSSTHDLLAWMTINEAGVWCHLYCLPQFRRRGYAEYIVKFATNDMLKKNKKVLLLTDDHNVQSRNLFKKMCFVCVGVGTWVYLKKNSDYIMYSLYLVLLCFLLCVALNI